MVVELEELLEELPALLHGGEGGLLVALLLLLLPTKDNSSPLPSHSGNPIPSCLGQPKLC